MLIFPFCYCDMTGVFAPTLFSKTFGDMVCDSCSGVPGNTTVPFTCRDCHYDTVSCLSLPVFIVDLQFRPPEGKRLVSTPLRSMKNVAFFCFKQSQTVPHLVLSQIE